jgi:cell division protease FtsH
VVSEKEKLRTAVHEAGHALCAWLEPKADPIDRVSIVPRGRSGGVTLFQPDEDRMDMAQSELTARLVVAMGGRAADRLVFGEPLSGAIQDLKQATRIARMMVTQFGMSDRLGPVAYRIGDEHVFLGKEIHESRDFSEGTAQIIDEEVQKLLSQAETRATDLLRKNRDDLDVLTQALLKEEELDRAGVEALLRKAPREETDSNAADAPQGAIDTDPPHPKLAIDGAGG